MTEFSLNNRIVSDICDRMYSISKLLSRAYQTTAEISNDFRRQSELYEVSISLNRDANILKELMLFSRNMGNMLNEGLMMYITCESRICEKYSENNHG